ncbi:hypothetical protein D9Q98_004721 [Chlorella vulgaris]|uniref:ubiquitinyl hydrolase 1 n=1 Tax=Chlorella vulgaris TaxID=3077 RepID=A0A9D4YY75_CHLVU|nr:hypothetical protein D9Q98_004721 [Chlorella vulgaris]
MKRSRPVKGKGKPDSGDLLGEEARSLKALIDTSGALTTVDVLRVLKADKPCEGLYSKSCKGKGGNPNCLCNLVPAPGGFRRQGLWTKAADVLGTLGPDPAANLREDRSKPVGLKNLGNTCYVNSVLQCLYANTAFRRAVYALKQPLADEPIVKELRLLFLSMEHGCSDPVDPEPLAKSLNLDHGVQQDGQEFMKLFLSLLEAKFGGQADVQGVIQALFRGQSGYLTVCQSCQQPSDSSARSDSFYEVDVPVKGFRSLQDSLNSMLMPETMEGDNQYSCERCMKKVDATRQLELRCLPPMLSFSLQRFVFDYAKMDRVKVSDKFAFPLTLDLAPIMCRPPSPDLVYQLEAIMIHKGGSATQGHYVAHIKLEGTPGCGSPASNQHEAAGQQAPASSPAAEVEAAAAPAVVAGGKQAAKAAGKPKAGGGQKAGAAKNAAAAAAGEGGATAAAAGAAAGGSGCSWWRFDDDAVTVLEGGPTSSSDHGALASKAAAGSAAAAAGGGKKAGKRGGGGAGTAAKGGRGGRGKAGGGRGGRGQAGKRGGRGRKAARQDDDDDEEEDFDTVSGSEDEAGEVNGDDELAAAMAASLQDAPRGGGGKVVPQVQPQQPSHAAAAAPAAGQAQAQDGQVQQGGQAQAPGQQQQQQLQQEEEIVSSNAYLLVYRRKGANLPMVPLDSEQEAALAAARAGFAEEQQRSAAAYADAKQQLLQRQQERQEEVRRIVETAAALEEGDSGRFVASEWLTKWADAGVEAGTPEPIDNSPLLCPHGGGKLDPNKAATDARRISTPAWQQLCASYRGGPELGPEDACPACLAALLDGIVAKEDTQGLKEHFLTVAALVLAGEGPEQGLAQDFFVSSTWLSAWLKRKGSVGSVPPTKDITCACGQLAPESSKSKRVAIPADFWRFLQRTWRAACAERRAKQDKRARKAAGDGVGSGGGGVWDVTEEQAAQQEQQQGAAGPPAAADRTTEVIDLDLDSPTAIGGEQQQRRRQQQQQQQQQQQRPRVRRGRGDGAAQVAGKEGKEEEEVQEVVVLDGDSDGGGGDVTPAVAAPAAAAAGAATTAAPVPEEQLLLEFPVGCSECAVCVGNLAEASHVLKGMQGRLQQEKAELAHLVHPQAQALTASQSYRLVPSAFMAQWRAYMQQAGKRALSPASKAAQIVQPPSLGDALLGVLCECHSNPSVKAEEGEQGAQQHAQQQQEVVMGEAQVQAVGVDGGKPEEPHVGTSTGSGWMLGYAPPAVTNRRGRWVLADADGGGDASNGGAAGADSAAFDVLPERDWYVLSAFYGSASDEGSGDGRKRRRQELQQSEQLAALLERGIEATLVVETPSPPPADAAANAPELGPQAHLQAPPQQPQPQGAAASSPAASPGKGHRPQRSRRAAGGGDVGLSEHDWEYSEANPYQLSRKPTSRQGAAGSAHFVTQPPLCQQAVAERQARRRAALLTYENEEIMLELAATVDEAVVAGDAAGGAGERKSKRARRGRAPVSVSSGDTLQQLRYHVLQTLDVHPKNARLFLRGAPLLAADEATLAECEVYPGDEIRVVDSGEHDGADLAYLFPSYSGKGKRAREAERGFTGTALTGLAPAATAGAEEGGKAADMVG